MSGMRLLEKIRSCPKGRLKEIFDRKAGFGRMEMRWNSNWFNPIATLYFNLRSFSFRDGIKMPVSIYGRPSFLCLSGKMRIDADVRRGMIKFNYTRLGAPHNGSVPTEINNCGEIVFCGGGIIGTGNRIVVNQQALLKIGSGFEITDEVIIGVHRRVELGRNCCVTHRCQICDTNYHYIENIATGEVKPYISEVKVGDDVWICNNSTIAPGSVIADYTVVASNSLVNSDMTECGSGLIGGIPAKMIARGYRRIYDKEKDMMLHRYFAHNPEATSVKFTNLKNIDDR